MRVVLGVGGGIAAYKSAELARALTGRGVQVQVVMTAAARSSCGRSPSPRSPAARSSPDLFPASDAGESLSSAVEHIGVAQANDILVVAPATADLLAKFAHGLADDFLTTMYLAFTGPVVLAPAMNTNMWRHPATQANLRDAARARPRASWGRTKGLWPAAPSAPAACPSRRRSPMPFWRVLDAAQDLEGETVLITAGPTQEPLDPVRYISNRSSGKMGYALAEAAAARGARVMLVSGPVHIPEPPGVTLVRVRTAQEMREAVLANLEPATIVIKAAAVADYHVASVPQQKMKKTAARLSLELDPTPDILAELGRRKGDRLLIGFAAETENLAPGGPPQAAIQELRHGRGQPGGQEGTGFESDANEVVLALATGAVIALPQSLQARNRGPHFRRGAEAPARPSRCPMNRELLRQVLSYYQDLGIQTLYRRAPPVERAVMRATPAVLPAATAGETAGSLALIREDIGDCTRCRLHERRTKIVFGSGNQQAKLVFVGEGPGADEDAQGLPFVGRAGQLLTQMIEGTAQKEGIPIKRQDVYICNVVKCRPPENRTPVPDEMEICGQFLTRQLLAIAPKAICVLGATAAKALLDTQGRRHQDARQLVPLARHPGDGDLPSLLPAARLQPEGQARSLGRPEESPPLCLRLSAGRGSFITFEGMDGSGKTTQMRLLAQKLRAAGYGVLESYEPGGTPIGTQVRRILLDAANQELCPTAELLLYFACRAQNVEQSILPALERRQDRALGSLHRFDPGLPGRRPRARQGSRPRARRDRLPRPGPRSDHADRHRPRDQPRPGALAQPRVSGKSAVAETRMDDQAVEFHRRVHDAYAELVAARAPPFRGHRRPARHSRRCSTTSGAPSPRASGARMFEDFHGNQRTTQRPHAHGRAGAHSADAAAGRSGGRRQGHAGPAVGRRAHRGRAEDRAGRLEPASQRRRDGRA